jgi:predicted negative regulator of RcsB-dependent stress response
MSITNLLITVVVLGVAGYFGWLRPTGLWSRNAAEREEDTRRDVATKWLNKDDK